MPADCTKTKERWEVDTGEDCGKGSSRYYVIKVSKCSAGSSCKSCEKETCSGQARARASLLAAILIFCFVILL